MNFNMHHLLRHAWVILFFTCTQLITRCSGFRNLFLGAHRFDFEGKLFEVHEYQQVWLAMCYQVNTNENLPILIIRTQQVWITSDIDLYLQTESGGQQRVYLVQPIYTIN